MLDNPKINLLMTPDWPDYELIDSGDGQKLERFAAYTFARPEIQALWSRGLRLERWRDVHAVFKPTGEESGGHWKFLKQIPARWEMRYQRLRFWAQTTSGRHLGVFPESAAHWDWLSELVESRRSQLNVLNLFGYTGLATLMVAQHGAKVTHLDASKKAVSWARENQTLSGLENSAIRWIVDDALKFVQREVRRGTKYHGIILDPPKFGRGPKGEVWQVYEALPMLLQACRSVLSPDALFVVLTMYAVRASAVHLHNLMAQVLHGLGGSLQVGELVIREESAGRLLSSAVYARWENK